MIRLPFALALFVFPALAAAAEPTLVVRSFFAVSKYAPDGTPNPKPGVELTGVPKTPSKMILLVRAMDGTTVKSFKIADGKIEEKQPPFFIPLAPAPNQPFSAGSLWVPSEGQYAFELWAPTSPVRTLPLPKDTVTSTTVRFQFKVSTGNWQFVAKNHDPIARPGTNPWPEPDSSGIRVGTTTDTLYR